jgi:hypothetical protein
MYWLHTLSFNDIMKLQFLYAHNPNMPEQGEYVYHEQFPRFRAKVEKGQLVIDEKFDGENEDYKGKLNRAQKWFNNIKSSHDRTR